MGYQKCNLFLGAKNDNAADHNLHLIFEMMLRGITLLQKPLFVQNSIPKQPRLTPLVPHSLCFKISIKKRFNFKLHS